MSCPDWSRLAALQDEEPETWASALEHLDACEACFDEALAAEPTLLFRRLPAPRMSSEDIAAIKGAVTTMRRTEPLNRPTVPKAVRHWRAMATAAAILMAVVLSGGGITGPAGVDTVASVDGTSASETVEMPLAEPVDVAPVIEHMPLVEDIDPAYGSVVQVMDAEMSLVLVLPSGDVS